MNKLFIIIFAIVTGIHLFASAKKDRRLRNQTKPFILLSLMGLYVFSVEKISAVVILALLFSWLGDVLLMKHGNKWFTIGGVAFMVSHFFFILSYIPYIDFSAVRPLIGILIGAFFFIAVSILFRKLKQYLPEKLYYPMYLYLLINGTMNCFAIFRLLSGVTVSSVVTVIGAILFFISDASLFFVRFRKDAANQNHFWVMLTYSLGELLIVLGFVIR